LFLAGTQPLDVPHFLIHVLYCLLFQYFYIVFLSASYLSLILFWDRVTWSLFLLFLLHRFRKQFRILLGKESGKEKKRTKTEENSFFACDKENDQTIKMALGM